MPIYEYACKNCGHEFEELIRGTEQPACPACGQSQVERQLSVSAAHTAGPANSACPSPRRLRHVTSLWAELLTLKVFPGIPPLPCHPT